MTGHVIHFAALGGLLLAGCSHEPPKAVESRPLAVVVSGDTAGWIVPCGCTSKQDGGLLRRATYVDEVRQAADVVLADAGGAPGGDSDYERLKFAAILRGELAMGLVAHNLGAAEAALGAETIRRLAEELKAPFVSCNVRDADGQLLAEPLRFAETSGRRIALAGVLSPSLGPAGLRVDEPRQAVLAALGGAREKFDVLVVLAYLPEDELPALAQALPEADLVLGGPTRQPVAPQRSGPTLWASATNKGKFLVDVRLPPGEENRWDGKIVELSPDWADHERQLENLRAFRQELALRDFSATETGLAPPLARDLPQGFRIAGGEACRQCHADACRQWDASSHSLAWQTLVEKQSQFDPACQQCHTTGYGQPGGFESVARSEKQTAVGCESCHGPSLAHAEQAKVRTIYAARDRCSRCHDRENSPGFAYDEYWPQIEHGKLALEQGAVPK